MRGFCILLYLCPADRWERTQGHFCRKYIEDEVTPEAVRDSWEKISDFTDAYHPASNHEDTGILAAVKMLGDLLLLLFFFLCFLSLKKFCFILNFM